MKGNLIKGLPETELEYLNGIYRLIEDGLRPTFIMFYDVFPLIFGYSRCFVIQQNLQPTCEFCCVVTHVNVILQKKIIRNCE